MKKCVNMGKRKTPAMKQKKASSATARKSSKKVSPGHTDLNGSFIQSVIPVEPDTTAASSSSQLPHTQDKSDSILTMLQRPEESNQAIMKRVSDLESQKSDNPVVRNPQLQPDVNTDILQNNMHLLISTLHSGTQLTGSGVQANTQAQALHDPSTSAATLQAIPSSLPTPPTVQHAAHFTSDGIVPNINVLRQNQNISQSVTYEAQARQDVAQKGKAPTKKSIEAVAIIPKLRWPNEGYYRVQGKRKATYDELSIPEWAADQLNNIY